MQDIFLSTYLVVDTFWIQNATSCWMISGMGYRRCVNYESRFDIFQEELIEYQYNFTQLLNNQFKVG